MLATDFTGTLRHLADEFVTFHMLTD